MMRRSYYFYIFVFIFALPVLVSAQVEITEIMYDPEGPDTGREWIELYNAGDGDLLIKGGSSNDSWRLYEESMAGKLNKRTFILEKGESSFIFPAKEYLIIANQKSDFLEDFPEYSGLLVESRISLTNGEGRKLALVDQNGNLVSDEVTYIPVPEAGNTGASLQKQRDGSWIAALPTPGKVNSDVPFKLPEKDKSDTEKGTGKSKDDFLKLESDWPFADETVFVNAGENKRVFVGEELVFEGEVRLKNGEEPRGRVEFLWAFGDGRGSKGWSSKYSYRRPGIYNVVLTVIVGGKEFTDRVKVQVLDREVIKLEEPSDDFVELVNSSDFEVEVSSWVLENEKDRIEFAKGTYLSPQSKVSIPFGLDQGQTLRLLDTRGVQVAAIGLAVSGAVATNDSPYEEILRRLTEMLNRTRNGR